MTRKDYKALADALSETRPPAFVFRNLPVDALSSHDAALRSQWLDDVNTISSVLRWDNPRFDPERFMKACMV